MPYRRRKINGFAILILVFAFATVSLMVWGYSRLLRLVPVEGELLWAGAVYKVEPLGGRNARGWTLEAHFRYAYGGKVYESDRLHVDGNWMPEFFAQRRAQALQPFNRRVTVWVDPKEPGYAVLERRPGVWGFLMLALLLALAWLVQRYLPDRGAVVWVKER